MASRNRAIVEELIRLMNTRDRRPMHLFHPDIEWHWAASIPGQSVYRGPTRTEPAWPSENRAAQGRGAGTVLRTALPR